MCFNSFAVKSSFNWEEAACAIVGVFDPKEARSKVEAIVRELENDFPLVEVPFVDYDGRVGFDFKFQNITRDQLLAWCEKKGIRPPLLFPDDPPAVPVPADNRTAQFKESDLLVTICRLMLLAKDLDNEIHHVARYARTRYERGSGISHKAVWEDIEAVLKRLGLSTVGLGSTKTREIFAAASRLGAAVPEEDI